MPTIIKTQWSRRQCAFSVIIICALIVALNEIFFAPMLFPMINIGTLRMPPPSPPTQSSMANVPSAGWANFILDKLRIDRPQQQQPQQQGITFTTGAKNPPQLQQFHINFKNIRQPYWMDVPTEGNGGKCPSGTKLLILIMSRRAAFTNREGIRQTWLQDARNGTVARFLIADAPPPPITEPTNEEGKEATSAESAIQHQQQLALVEEEQREHGDLIFLHGIVDSYQNLHLKWLGGLHWQQAFCPSARWLLKSDDDTVVDLPRLWHWIEGKFRVELMENAASAAAYFGYMISGVGPIRDPANKWYVPASAYPSRRYPKYMNGPTYVASTQAISAILPHIEHVNGFNMDDVLFTGILAEMANVRRINHGEMFLPGDMIGTAIPVDCDDDDDDDAEPFVTALHLGGGDAAIAVQTFRDHYAKLASLKCATQSQQQQKRQKQRRRNQAAMAMRQQQN